jgi:hypothetical protein
MKNREDNRRIGRTLRMNLAKSARKTLEIVLFATTASYGISPSPLLP